MFDVYMYKSHKYVTVDETLEFTLDDSHEVELLIGQLLWIYTSCVDTPALLSSRGFCGMCYVPSFLYEAKEE